jgi:hypothetical protein
MTPDEDDHEQNLKRGLRAVQGAKISIARALERDELTNSKMDKTLESLQRLQQLQSEVLTFAELSARLHANINERLDIIITELEQSRE